MDTGFTGTLTIWSEGTEMTRDLSEAVLHSRLRGSRFVPLNNASLHKSQLNSLGSSVPICKPRRLESSQILCWTWNSSSEPSSNFWMPTMWRSWNPIRHSFPHNAISYLIIVTQVIFHHVVNQINPIILGLKEKLKWISLTWDSAIVYSQRTETSFCNSYAFMIPSLDSVWYWWDFPPVPFIFNGIYRKKWHYTFRLRGRKPKQIIHQTSEQWLRQATSQPKDCLNIFRHKAKRGGGRAVLKRTRE